MEYVYKNFDQIETLFLENGYEMDLVKTELFLIYNALIPVNQMTVNIQKEDWRFGDLKIELEKMFLELDNFGNAYSVLLTDCIRTRFDFFETDLQYLW